jgi:hypothetical protein
MGRFFDIVEDYLEFNEESKKKIMKGIEEVKKGEVLSTKEALEYFRDKK